jgi:hypothetical protein
MDRHPMRIKACQLLNWVGMFPLDPFPTLLTIRCLQILYRKLTKFLLILILIIWECKPKMTVSIPSLWHSLALEVPHFVFKHRLVTPTSASSWSAVNSFVLRLSFVKENRRGVGGCHKRHLGLRLYLNNFRHILRSISLRCWDYITGGLILVFDLFKERFLSRKLHLS